MTTYVGQCRGDLALLLRQLHAVGVRNRATQRGAYDFVAPAKAHVVVLGDLVGPRNAWSAGSATVASDDLEILRLTVALCEQTGASALAGLHELLLFSGTTTQCGHGENHRRLLRYVSSDEFRAAWDDATRRVPRHVRRAARHVDAILQDNATRPPPAGFERQWPLLSTYDRGTRFLVHGADAAHTGFGSTAFDPDPAALAHHLAHEHHRLRAPDAQTWQLELRAIARPYADFEAARRACLAVHAGVAVRDPAGALLAPDAARAFRAALERALARAAAAAPAAPALARAAAAALGL
jgi:hypothetical protein